MSHELFLTTRQKAKIRNAYARNMLTDTKLNEAPISTIIQSGRFLVKKLVILGNLGKAMAKGVKQFLLFF